MSFGKVIQFLKDVRIELTKVTWPNREELIGSTIIVIVLSIIMSIYIGFLDYLLSSIFGRIIR